MFPVDIAKFLRIAFLYNTSSCCFWQPYHGTVKSPGVPFIWFRASTCFQFWSKTLTKRCTNNSLLSRDKTISSLSMYLLKRSATWNDLKPSKTTTWNHPRNIWNKQGINWHHTWNQPGNNRYPLKSAISCKFSSRIWNTLWLNIVYRENRLR